MSWLDVIPRAWRGPIAVAIVLAGGVYATAARNPWGLVVAWAGITLAFAGYLHDEAELRQPDGKPRNPPDDPIF